jgi:serine/threonine protein kinase
MNQVSDRKIQNVNERFFIKSLLGSGGFGALLRVVDKQDDEEKALKMFQIEEDFELAYKTFLGIKALGDKCYKGLVCYHEIFMGNFTEIPEQISAELDYGIDLENSYACILMSLVPGVSLDFYQETHKNIPESTVLSILKQSLYVLCILHSNGWVHRDIKDENIMIDPKTLTITLIDYDFFCQYGKNLPYSCDIGGGGTYLYMSPEWRMASNAKKEMTEDQQIKSDIWGLGVTMYHLITGEYPYVIEPPKLTASDSGYYDDIFTKLSKLNSKDNRNLVKKLHYPNKQIEKVINSMLEYDSDRRPESLELMKMIQNS